MLTLFGGRRRKGSDSTLSIRSDPHILVVGDPGLGKSQMLLAAVKLAPRGVYVGGNTATAAGLTVSVSHSAESGTALEAGALVLGDQGVCCIDELDKMPHRSALLEAMEQQCISIAKAGIVCSLPARTSIIAAANPVDGHYNKSKTVAENLKMEGAVLSRFDLVFVIVDKADVEMDAKLSEHIMQLHSGRKSKPLRSDTAFTEMPVMESSYTDETNLETRLKRGKITDPIPTSLLRKYISYARTYSHPQLTPPAAEILQQFYLDLRRYFIIHGSEYRGSDGMPVTTRQLEAMIRLSEARARMELRESVTASDARDVIEIMKSALWGGYTNQTGVLSSKPTSGAGRGSAGDMKRVCARLMNAYESIGKRVFTMLEIEKVCGGICSFILEIGVGDVARVVERLNVEGIVLLRVGYLLKKGGGRYELGII